MRMVKCKKLPAKHVSLINLLSLRRKKNIKHCLGGLHVQCHLFLQDMDDNVDYHPNSRRVSEDQGDVFS